MARHISDERQTTYYVGMGLQIIGGLLFASTLITFLINFGDFNHFEDRARSNGIRGFGGIALLIIGGIVRAIGARGLAGSGMILDPEQVRDDLEPYSRMAGGMARDLLGEADLKFGNTPEKVIMIKCQSCAGLNQEAAKFCQQCGTHSNPVRPATRKKTRPVSELDRLRLRGHPWHLPIASGLTGGNLDLRTRARLTRGTTPDTMDRTVGEVGTISG